MKTILSAALGLSLIIGSAALSFGAQDPAAPAKTDKMATDGTTKTAPKAKHTKKVKTPKASTTPAATTPAPSK